MASSTIPEKFLDLLTTKKPLASIATIMSDGTPQVTPVWFDYTKPETLGTPSRGADAVFMVPPFSPDGVAESLEFLQAASESGVKHIVKLSVIRSLGNTTVGKWHAAIDEADRRRARAIGRQE